MSAYIKQSVQAMQGYTPGEQPTDPQVIKLNTNESPYPPSPAVREALQSLKVETLRLYPDPVSLTLRRKIAALHGGTPDNVFVGNGSDETLALCSRAFVEDDGAIGYFEPSYSLYPVLAQIRAVTARPVALGPDFEWAMPPDYQASLFFMTTPNAPTGIQYPKTAIRAFCTHFPGVVVLDEAYVDFAREHCMDLALEFANVLVLRTLSKSYALAGLETWNSVRSAVARGQRGCTPLMPAKPPKKTALIMNIMAMTQPTIPKIFPTLVIPSPLRSMVPAAIAFISLLPITQAMIPIKGQQTMPTSPRIRIRMPRCALMDWVDEMSFMEIPLCEQSRTSAWNMDVGPV